MKKFILFLLFTLVGLTTFAINKQDTLYVNVPAVIKIKTDSLFKIKTFTKDNLKVDTKIIDSKIYIKPKYNYEINDTVYICINTPRNVIIKPGKDFEISNK